MSNQLITSLENLLTRWQERHDSSTPAHDGGHNVLSDCMHELDDVVREAKRAAEQERQEERELVTHYRNEPGAKP